MISDEKKKRIESLSTDEMLLEINLGRKSRFQREAFAYLQTCYQKRTTDNDDGDKYCGGITWVDMEYDPNFQEKDRFKTLKLIWSWIFKHIFTTAITTIVIIIITFYLNQWLSNDTNNDKNEPQSTTQQGTPQDAQ